MMLILRITPRMLITQPAMLCSQINIASHSAAEQRDVTRIPSGLEFWSVEVDITQLEVVFLYRFLQVHRHLSKTHSVLRFCLPHVLESC